MAEKGEENKSALQLAPGTIFDKYKVIRLIGRGGMGEVYEVEHEVLEKRYALKLLPSSLREQQGFLERFKREAQVMAHLEHPNIIKVDDFGDTEGKLWLRMELAEGIKIPKDNRFVTLRDLAEFYRGKIEQGLFMSILEQVLEGLSYAHGRGAVHRDLKPDNILIVGGSVDGEEGLQVKISDFGLVRLVGEEWVKSKVEVSVSQSTSLGDGKTEEIDKSGSSTRALLGTYEYMSPEQKRGETADERSDVYTLGLMTYRLLTGMKEITFKLPSQIDNKLSSLWDRLVEKATQPNREERIESAGSMLEIVREIKDKNDKIGKNCVKPGTKDDKGERAGTELPMRIVPATSVLILCVIFVLALVFWFFGSDQEKKEVSLLQSSQLETSAKLVQPFTNDVESTVLSTTSVVMNKSEEIKKPLDVEKVVSFPEDNLSEHEEYKHLIERLTFLDQPIKQPGSPFQVDIWADHLKYQIGDEITFYYKANKDCYLTIIDIGATGNITVLFPNRFKQDNFIQANTLYTIPSEEYDKFSFKVEPPSGIDRVKAIASLTPLTIEHYRFEEYAFRSINPTDTAGTRDIGVYLEKLSESPKENKWVVDSLSILIK